MTHCKDQSTSFLVLNHAAAWERGLAVNLRVSEEGLQISRTYEYAEEREIELEALTGGSEVTDFAAGACGLIYMLVDDSDAPTQSLWIYDAQQSRIERLTCTDALLTKTASSIVYAPGHLYVADTEGWPRLFALAEINWQVRWALDARNARELPLGQSPPAPILPVDLATDRQGNLYALDAANRLVLKLDAAGRFVSSFGAAELAGLNPRALTIAPDGSLYVLDPEAMRVLKFDTGDPEAATVSEALIDFAALIADHTLPRDFVPAGLASDSAGNLFIGDGRETKGTHEDDRFIRRFSSAGAYLGEVTDFSGQVSKMVVNADDWIYIFSRADQARRIFILKPERKYARLPGTSLVKGRYFSLALDSAESQTQWHKYLFDASLPPNTQIQVSYLASDSPLLSIGGSQRDLDALLHAAHTATDEEQARLVNQLERLEWSVPTTNAPDALINRTFGRYLWLRVELVGSEQASPVVSSLRVDFPRTSYLRYLPAVYQEDERSRDFLERFLSLFETFFGGLEREIDQIARYFDAAAVGTSGEYLRWLASWLAIAVDKSWSEESLRALVGRAPALYKKRGTRAGLEEMIEILTGERPLIVEHFQRLCAGGEEDAAGSPDSGRDASDEAATGLTNASAAGMRDSRRDGLAWLYARLYGRDPYCFCVLLKPFQVKTDEERMAVRRLLDAEKPAHTCASMMILQPWIHLDMHTYMGVNTYLSQPSAALDRGGAIPRDTVLDDRDEGGQVERRSRLDGDIILT